MIDLMQTAMTQLFEKFITIDILKCKNRYHLQKIFFKIFRTIVQGTNF